MSVPVCQDRERAEIGGLYHRWVSAISSSQLDIPQSFGAAWQCLLLITSVHLSHLALHLLPAVDSLLHICVHISSQDSAVTTMADMNIIRIDPYVQMLMWTPRSALKCVIFWPVINTLIGMLLGGWEETWRQDVKLSLWRSLGFELETRKLAHI